MLRSGRRREFVDKIRAVVSELPVLRLSGETSWDIEDRDWLISTGTEIEIDGLMTAHDVQANADKRHIEDDWEAFVDALSTIRRASQRAHQLANQMAASLSAEPVDRSELSISHQVFEHHVFLSPLYRATLAVAAAQEHTPADSADEFVNGLEIYVGPKRTRRWQVACAAALLMSLVLLVHSFTVVQLQHTAANERIPLSEIPILHIDADAPTSATADDASAHAAPADSSAPARPSAPTPALPEPTAAGSAPAASAPTAPPDHPHAERDTAAHADEAARSTRMSQRAIASSSIDHFVIVPPARSGQIPISVSIQPYTPRRSQTTPETVRRIVIPKSSDLLNLDLHIPSEVLDPVGQSEKKTQITIQWREVSFNQRHLKETF